MQRQVESESEPTFLAHVSGEAAWGGLDPQERSGLKFQIDIDLACAA